MTRIEVNCQTGEVKTVPLTQAEIDAGLARKALEDAYNSLDNTATRATDGMNRLLFDVSFALENRIRVLELKVPVTKAQYRDALIALYKTL